MAINLLKLIRIVFSFQIFVAHTESGVSEPSDPSDPILCDSEVKQALFQLRLDSIWGYFPMFLSSQLFLICRVMIAISMSVNVIRVARTHIPIILRAQINQKFEKYVSKFIISSSENVNQYLYVCFTQIIDLDEPKKVNMSYLETDSISNISKTSPTLSKYPFKFCNFFL